MRRISLKSKVRFFLIPIFALFFLIRCDDTDFPFPDVTVNATFYLSSNLTNMLVGDSRLIDGHGIGGLIIYRADTKEFKAFDRACTYEATKECVLIDDGTMFECPCCESRFWMVQGDIAGSVYQGPAKYPLKQYRCSFDGTNAVRVTN